LAPSRPDVFFAALVRKLIAGLCDDGGDGADGLLFAFLRVEARALWTHEPVAFEQVFGEMRRHRPDAGDGLPELVLPVPGGPPVRVSGAIDRIDRARIDPSRIVVLDYKTGRVVPRRAQIARGIRLQIPLYLAAVAGALRPEQGGYFHLYDAAEFRRNL